MQYISVGTAVFVVSITFIVVGVVVAAMASTIQDELRTAKKRISRLERQLEQNRTTVIYSSDGSCEMYSGED